MCVVKPLSRTTNRIFTAAQQGGRIKAHCTNPIVFYNNEQLKFEIKNIILAPCCTAEKIIIKLKKKENQDATVLWFE